MLVEHCLHNLTSINVAFQLHYIIFCAVSDAVKPPDLFVTNTIYFRCRLSSYPSSNSKKCSKASSSVYRLSFHSHSFGFFEASMSKRLNTSSAVVVYMAAMHGIAVPTNPDIRARADIYDIDLDIVPKDWSSLAA